MDTILLVDDQTRLRALVREWLSSAFSGVRIIEAASGEEAVARAETSPITLVVMDIGLPGMNGIEAARILITKHPRIRIVMLSIHEEARYLQEAAAAGAHAYVTKGNLQERLIPTVREQLDSRTITRVAANEKTEDLAHTEARQ